MATYNNTGAYNAAIITGIAKSYCKWKQISYNPQVELSNDFLDFIMYVFETWAYGKTVKRFIRVYKKQRLENGTHDPDAAKYMLETFTNLYQLRFKKWNQRMSSINSEIIYKVEDEQRK